MHGGNGAASALRQVRWLRFLSQLLDRGVHRRHFALSSAEAPHGYGAFLDLLAARPQE